MTKGRPKKPITDYIVNTKKGVIDDIAGLLFNEGAIYVNNVGRFSLREIKKKKLFHNFSNKEITIKKHYRINFEPCPELKKICKDTKKQP